MGLDANTHIWIGVQMGNSRGESKNPLWGVPEEIYDRLEDRGEVEVEGLMFRRFYHAENPVGFGVELLDHGWREGLMELDLVTLNQKVRELMPRVKWAFEAMQITDEPKVWLATNLP